MKSDRSLMKFLTGKCNSKSSISTEGTSKCKRSIRELFELASLYQPFNNSREQMSSCFMLQSFSEVIVKSEVVVNYYPEFLHWFLQSIILSLQLPLLSYLFVSDKLGCRFLFIVGSIGCGLSLLVAAFGASHDPSKEMTTYDWIFMVGVYIFVGFFVFSHGFFTWSNILAL